MKKSLVPCLGQEKYKINAEHLVLETKGIIQYHWSAIKIAKEIYEIKLENNLKVFSLS